MTDKLSYFDVSLLKEIVEKELKKESFDIDERFRLFFARAKQRLVKGEIEYGNRSFDKSPIEIIGEIEEECLDLAVWGFILWIRLQREKDVLNKRYSL